MGVLLLCSPSLLILSLGINQSGAAVEPSTPGSVCLAAGQNREESVFPMVVSGLCPSQLTMAEHNMLGELVPIIPHYPQH